MVRYWAISSYPFGGSGTKRKREAFKRVWEYDREHGVIAIGWGSGLGDPSSLSQEELDRRYLEVYPGRTGGLHQVRKFWFEIQPGDRIIAKGGRRKIVGVGTVKGKPYYDPAKGQERAWFPDFFRYEILHECFLPVQWDDVEEKELPRMVFNRITLQELPEDKFKDVTGGS